VRAAPTRCPAEMALVKDRYCVDRHEASLEAPPASGSRSRPHSPYHRPAPATRFRATSRQGVVPQAYVNQREASQACRAAGKRLCTNAEWVTACRGKVPTVYPYGMLREPGRCNDRGVSPMLLLYPKPGEAEFTLQTMNDPRLNQIEGTVARTGAFSGCQNSYGLFDMVGNLHEWTADPGGVFLGGYYLDTTSHGEGCNYITAGHDTLYHDYSIGFRCCKDAQR
jgi:hypothetical protein